MLQHLRTRVAELLAGPHQAMLATCGPGDIQAGLFPCQAQGLRLYLLVPRASDHLFNLEVNPDVVVATHRWQLRGRARILAAEDAQEALHLDEFGDLRWSVLVEVVPLRLQVAAESGGLTVETIDVDGD